MIKLVNKDFKLFFSNKRDVLLTFLVPIALATLFALIFGRMGNGGEGVNEGGIVQSIVGTAIMMSLFSVADIGASFLDEKEKGMLKKLLWAPLPKHHILFGKIIYANCIVIIQLLVVFLFGQLAFGLDLFKNFPAALFMILIIAYAASSFGIVLSTLARSRKQIQAYSTLVILIMSGVGGSMIPVNMMPEFMQKAAMGSINYWGMQGFYDIFLRDRSFFDLVFLKNILVLILIGTVLNGLAFLLFKKNLTNIA